MKQCTTNLIPENIAPIGAKRIAVLDSSNKEVGKIPLGRLARPTESPLYSFCALADVHVHDTKYPTSTEDFRRALLYAEENCAFTCIAGDLTDQGINDDFLLHYQPTIEGVKPTKPIYAIAGNHENYSTVSKNWLESYTGYPLYYSLGVDKNGICVDLDKEETPKEYNSTVKDVFIMVGHYGGYHDENKNWLASEFVSAEELKWLYNTLELNQNKRCFVFCHVLPHKHGVGDPNNLYSSDPTKPLLWDVADGGIGQTFIDLLRHYKNAILFHGHTHTRLDLQELDPKANYSNADGYRSIHIPSLAVPRDAAGSGTALQKADAESEGYIVDVYDGYIVLNGRDFVGGDEDGHWIPLGTYKIDTTLQNVEAGTFADSTGLLSGKE